MAHEPPEMSPNVRLWIELTIKRVTEGNKVNMEFAMFPRRTDPSKVVVVDTSDLRSKDEAALLCKIAVARESPDEYLFSSESYMLVKEKDQDERFMEAALRGDLSLKEIPGVRDILVIIYGSETSEYMHIVHLKKMGVRYLVKKREWIQSDNDMKQRGRFTQFRELQQEGLPKRREN